MGPSYILYCTVLYCTEHEAAEHIQGPQCRCTECGKLKDLEDKWIMRLGTYEDKGLNDRNEIKSKCRGQF